MRATVRDHQAPTPPDIPNENVIDRHRLESSARDAHRQGASDGIDFVRAIYLPYCDLWRGDKAFSDLLVKHRVNFSERVVPTLASLPERIEMEIGKLRSAAQS